MLWHKCTGDAEQRVKQKYRTDGNEKSIFVIGTLYECTGAAPFATNNQSTPQWIQTFEAQRRWPRWFWFGSLSSKNRLPSTSNDTPENRRWSFFCDEDILQEERKMRISSDSLWAHSALLWGPHATKSTFQKKKRITSDVCTWNKQHICAG